MGVTDDLDAGADDRPFADDDVAGDLGGGEEDRRRGDRRDCAAVRVELCHAESLHGGFDRGRGGFGDGQIAVAQLAEALKVGRRHSSDDPCRAPNGDHVAGEGHAGRYEGALTEEHPVAEPASGHEDRCVPNLAKIAYRDADGQAAMPECRAPANVDGNAGGADDHRVLDHRGPGADRDAAGSRANDGTFGEQRAGPEPDTPDNDRRPGDPRRRLLDVPDHGVSAHWWANDGAPSTAKARSSR